jgi:hypothetical protein
MEFGLVRVNSKSARQFTRDFLFAIVSTMITGLSISFTLVLSRRPA